jgi:DNA primase
MENVLNLLQGRGVTPRKVSSGKYGDEYHSGCPFCGDGSPRQPSKGPSDRFQVWPDRKDGGFFRCRRCGIYGDNIQFVIETEGKTFPQACAALGIDLPNNYVTPAKMTPRPPKESRQDFLPHTYEKPHELWMEKAESFVGDCHAHLMKSGSALSWLAGRGIKRETAEKYRLGYNPGKDGKPLYKSRKAWGLPEIKAASGKEKPLWLPVGLVVPMLDADGRVVQMRIRRNSADREAFLPELKYYVVPGGSQATMVLNRGARCFVCVEAGLDAILIAQDASGLDTGAVTTWNASAKPDAVTCELLANSMRIVVALDADDAGEKGSEWWTQTFRQARRLVPVGGKDPGEMFAAGRDIRTWLLDGLPPAITMFADDEDVSEEGVPTETIAVEVPGKEEARKEAGPVDELGSLLSTYPVQIVSTGKRLGLRGVSRLNNDDVLDRFSRLVFFNSEVMAYLDTHPGSVITAANYFDGR